MYRIHCAPFLPPWQGSATQAMGKDRFKRARGKRLGLIGEAKRSVPIFYDFMDSKAFKALTDAQKVVLLHVLRAYCEVSRWDVVNLYAVGFTCPFRADYGCDRKTWKTALRRLCAVGFLDYPPELQDTRPCQPMRFRMSERWKAYRPTEAEAEREAARLARERKRADEDRARLKRALQSLKAEATKPVSRGKISPVPGGSNSPVLTEGDGKDSPVLPPSNGLDTEEIFPRLITSIHVPCGHGEAESEKQRVRARNLAVLAERLRRGNARSE